MQAIPIKNGVLFICFCITLSFCSMPEAAKTPPSPLSFAKAKQIALAPPIIQSEQVFFEKENLISFAFGLEGAKIYYTLDGSEPTENTSLYDSPIFIEESTTIKAKAFHTNFLPSETVEAQFIRLGANFPIKNITLNRTPHDNYQGSGPEGLIDRKKGSTNFRTTSWMGFDGGVLDAVVEFKTAADIHKITASVLSDPASWIFTPQSMIIYGSNDGKEYTKLSTLILPVTSEGAPNTLKFITASFPQTSVLFVKVVLQHFDAIPQWHPGKGTPPWLFIDEILIE